MIGTPDGMSAPDHSPHERVPTASSAGVRLVRLKRRADFLRLAASGIRAARPGLVLQAAPRNAPSRPASRSGTGEKRTANTEIGVGFTTTRKLGKAVVRNRIRRRLREAARRVLTSHGRPGTDYVLIGRKGTLDRSFADLERDLSSALEQVHRRLDRRPPPSAGKGRRP